MTSWDRKAEKKNNLEMNIEQEKNNRIEEQILIKEKNPSSTCCYTHFPAQLRKK